MLFRLAFDSQNLIENINQNLNGTTSSAPRKLSLKTHISKALWITNASVKESLLKADKISQKNACHLKTITTMSHAFVARAVFVIFSLQLKAKQS